MTKKEHIKLRCINDVSCRNTFAYYSSFNISPYYKNEIYDAIVEYEPCGEITLFIFSNRKKDIGHRFIYRKSYHTIFKYVDVKQFFDVKPYFRKKKLKMINDSHTQERI